MLKQIGWTVMLLGAAGSIAAAQTSVTTSGGTTNTVPVFTGNATIGNSNITQSGSNVGIGTASPDQALTVQGVIHTIPSAGWGDSNTAYDYLGDANNGISAKFGGYTQVFGYWGVQLVQQGSIGVTFTGSKVGIGTTTPSASLEVNGSVKLSSGSGASMTFQDGSVQSVAWNGVLSGGDYAESVDVTGDRKAYEPGDVLVVDPTSEGKFLKSSKSYSTSVTGVYSTKPGAVGRRQVSDRSHMTEEVPMAMVGIIPTKVCAEGGPIQPGDLLVTSSTPGCAMKGTDRAQMLGAVIGKALGHLGSGTGVIEVVVTLQ